MCRGKRVATEPPPDEWTPVVGSPSPSPGSRLCRSNSVCATRCCGAGSTGCGNRRHRPAAPGRADATDVGGPGFGDRPPAPGERAAAHGARHSKTSIAIFTAEAANRVWLADITYIPTAEGWLYLAAVMGLFSRRIVGWAMRDTMQVELASAAPKHGRVAVVEPLGCPVAAISAVKSYGPAGRRHGSQLVASQYFEEVPIHLTS